MSGYYCTDEQKAFLREAIPGHVWQETSALYEERFREPLTRGQVLGVRHRLGVRGAMRHAADAPPPANALPVGTVRADDKGDLWVKVCESWRDNPDNEGLAEAPRNGCWRRKSHIEWEKANGGGVPEGHRIVFANRDHADFSPGNLVAIPAATLAAICALRLDYHDRETLEASMAVARIRSGLAADGPKAKRQRHSWTDGEDAMILAKAATDRVLARRFGVTAGAVRNRRWVLGRRRGAVG